MISNSTLDIIPFFVMRKKKAANQKLDFIKLKYSNQSCFPLWDTLKIF